MHLLLYGISSWNKTASSPFQSDGLALRRMPKQWTRREFSTDQFGPSEEFQEKVVHLPKRSFLTG